MAKGNFFVTVNDAKEIINRNVKGRAAVLLKTEQASGFVLAQTIKSPIHSPLFDHSAMDGFAFRYSDYSNGSKIFIEGESAAGSNYTHKLKRNQAVRIFTGAAIPNGADTVVMQEKVVRDENKLVIMDPSLIKGANIRLKGSQISKGKSAIGKGTVLNPGSVGFVASLGIPTIKVFPKPRVAIVVTGNELISPGKTIKLGQIFESNSHTLLAALYEDRIHDVKVIRVKDDFEATKRVFEKTLKEFDFILFTGGISVGDYDFVSQVMEDSKVKTLFYKVKQKPGKPLYFGSKNSVMIFGIPGNPASVLTCYYEFVKPALQKFYGHPSPGTTIMHLELTESIFKKTGLTHFLKGVTDFKTVTPLPGQESYILKSFISANCLIVLNESETEKHAGDKVEVHLL